MGMTRDQVLSRYGEPKSQIAAGNRVVMFYARERLVLRDGVVVEVERLASEPVRRPAPVEVPAPAPQPAPVAAAGTVTAPVLPAALAGATTTPAPSAMPDPVPTGSVAAPAPAPAPAPVPPPPPEPKLEIKLVRPPSANYTRPAPRPETPPQPIVPVLTPPEAKVAVESTPPPPPGRSLPEPVPVSPKPGVPPVETGATASRTVVNTSDAPAPVTVTPEPPDTTAEDAAREEAAAALEAEKAKKLKVAKARRRLAEAGDTEEPDIGEAFLTKRTLAIAFFVIGGGIWYLFWRNRQRQLELAATAVSHTPFSPPIAATAGAGAIFDAALLAKLEWKRFEELVADYYTKTGVVAVRTKSGPATPVHIKISWKGEPRPFACVQCIAHPVGLVDAKPLQELVALLTAEDIRRGYVVTTGKFNVNARDYAEEKHITLLPGDIFLEKLNALPDAARSEIMQTLTTGDHQTPSCPKCDAKMVRTTDDPPMWKCGSHADQLIPVWK